MLNRNSTDRRFSYNPSLLQCSRKIHSVSLESLATQAHESSNWNQKPAQFELFEYQIRQILRNLQQVVKESSSSFEVARRRWQEQCGSYIECQGLKFKPIQYLGTLLLKNGHFLVLYCQLLEISPFVNGALLRNHFRQNYAKHIILNSLVFRRFFKTQILKEDRQPDSQHEQPSGIPLKRQPTFEQCRRRRHSRQNSNYLASQIMRPPHQNEQEQVNLLSIEKWQSSLKKLNMNLHE